MSELDTVRARYAGKANDEWKRLEATPITRTEYLITSDCLRRYLPTTGAVLDAGSGPGRYAVDLVGQGYRVVMLDLVRAMLQLGREKAREAGIHANLGLVEGDLARLPYADDSFDAVISLGAPLSHITDAWARSRAVAEMARIVRAGQVVLLTGCTRLAAYRGAVFWMDLAFFDQMASSEARERGILDGSQLWYMFAPGELEALARTAGLDIVARVGCEGLANYLPWQHLLQLEEDPKRWPVWRDMLLETCEEESILGLSSHLLVVARKP
ncbi:MAG: methyltransferase domain-containing protein [Anaerolineae bacterium]|nr:methyltransferase domain-containing protein [Anaerolineae bacterium]